MNRKYCFTSSFTSSWRFIVSKLEKTNYFMDTTNELIFICDFVSAMEYSKGSPLLIYMLRQLSRYYMAYSLIPDINLFSCFSLWVWNFLMPFLFLLSIIPRIRTFAVQILTSDLFLLLHDVILLQSNTSATIELMTALNNDQVYFPARFFQRRSDFAHILQDTTIILAHCFMVRSFL